MLTRRHVLFGGSLAVAGLSGVLVPQPASATEPGTRWVVVVQQASPLTELSMLELKRLYVSEQLRDPKGQRIIPFNHAPGTPERVAFDQLVLKLDPEAMGRFWIDRKIRGQPSAPRSVSPLELLRSAVAAIPGGLGYLRESDVDARLRVLSIDGRRPADAGYPLQ